jgi:type VI secretion system protein ImpL
MKRFLVAALKILLLILLFVAAAVGSYALVNYMAWPWWAGACLFGGLIGLATSVLFLRKWLLRRRERRFVKRIIDQDETAIAAAPAHERQRLRDLQERWKEAVELLRASELRKRGNPLYVLPWYMVFGESDSGKTTAITNSRLTSILTDVGPMPGVSATKNCDWWFFEEAIILDTAGRYAIPLDESQDKEEWEHFLTLLVKYRKREPLNGLIITVLADQLLAGNIDALTEYGRGIRRRVDTLMRVLGARFPVYVLVTKLDLVFGMKGLIEVLPEEALSQAMGLVNEATCSDPEAFVDKTVLSVTERLRELRLLLLDSASRFDPAFLLFSDELGRLAPGLKAFSKAVFEDNSYQESPLLRGIFFSSGEQKGELHSEFLSGLASLGGIKRRLPDTNRGVFLHDFFSKVLPRDRNLFTPIMEYLRWKLLTRNLGMASWLLGLFFVCGLLSLSYLGNLRAMNDLFDAFPKKPAYSANVDERVVEMASFRQRITHLDELNSNWWVPRMGLDISLEAQEKVQALYCEQFKRVLLEPFDAQLHRAIGKLDTKPAEQLTSDYIALLVWRIDLIKSQRAGGTFKTLSARQMPAGNILAEVVPGFNQDLMGYFGQNYIAYLLWNNDKESLREQQLLLEAGLGKVLSLKGNDFNWLVDWANQNPAVHPVTYRDFWGGPPLPLGDDVYIPPAYTTAGREVLKNFLTELRNAMKDTTEFDKQEKRFWAWYADSFYTAWYEFADHFREGEGQLLTMTDHRDMAARMSTVDNPYYSLLTRMQTEFAPLKDFATPPDWVGQVAYFNAILAQYKASKSKGVAEISERAEDALRKTMAELGGTLAVSIEKRIEAANKLDSLMAVLANMGHFADTQKDAFKSATALYPGGGGSSGGSDAAGAANAAGAASPAGGKPGSKSPVDEAAQAISTLKSLMGIKGRGEGLFWDMVSGPLRYIVYVITMEASCELQELWEGRVMAEVAHVPSDKRREKLFGKSGLVNAFTSGPAKPFLRRDAKGWHGQSWFGIPFPFLDDFFTFLNEGARGSQQLQPEYKVTMSTVPTTVNVGASEEPYATRLEVECGSEQQVLNNFNYSESKVFTWKPEECGATTLTIEFPGLKLARIYDGKFGFAKFLDDFRQGAKTFTLQDFPEQRRGLAGLGVRSITVGYTFKGATPVLGVLDIEPINLPESITDCWQQ